jgi:hypothetical protein
MIELVTVAPVLMSCFHPLLSIVYTFVSKSLLLTLTPPSFLI